MAMAKYCSESLINFMQILPSDAKLCVLTCESLQHFDWYHFNKSLWKAEFDAHLSRLFAIDGGNFRAIEGLIRLNDFILFGKWEDLKKVTKAIAQRRLLIQNGLDQWSQVVTQPDALAPKKVIGGLQETISKRMRLTWLQVVGSMSARSAEATFRVISECFPSHHAQEFAFELVWLKFPKITEDWTRWQKHMGVGVRLIAAKLTKVFKRSVLPTAPIRDYWHPEKESAELEETAAFLRSLFDDPLPPLVDENSTDFIRSLISQIQMRLTDFPDPWLNKPAVGNSVIIVLAWLAGFKDPFTAVDKGPKCEKDQLFEVVELVSWMSRSLSGVASAKDIDPSILENTFLRSKIDFTVFGFSPSNVAPIKWFLLPMFALSKLYYVVLKKSVLVRATRQEIDFELNQLLTKTVGLILRVTTNLLQAGDLTPGGHSLQTFDRVAKALVTFLINQKGPLPFRYINVSAFVSGIAGDPRLDHAALLQVCERLDRMELEPLIMQYQTATANSQHHKNLQSMFLRGQLIKGLLDALGGYSAFDGHFLVDRTRAWIEAELRQPSDSAQLEQSTKRVIVGSPFSASHTQSLGDVFKQIMLLSKVRFKQSRAWLKRAEKQLYNERLEEHHFETFYELKWFVNNLGLGLTTPEIHSIVGLHSWNSQVRDITWRMTPHRFLEAYRGWQIRKRLQRHERRTILQGALFAVIFGLSLFIFYQMDQAAHTSAGAKWSTVTIFKLGVLILMASISWLVGSS